MPLCAHNMFNIEILADFDLAVIARSAKFNSPPNFPAIQQTISDDLSQDHTDIYMYITLSRYMMEPYIIVLSKSLIRV